MSFFGKLKSKLFKSSSKLEEGLDAIVQEGGTEDAPDTAPETPEVPQTPAPETPAPETPAPETPAPETPAPETPAPETPAPETPGPDVPPPVPETPPAPAPEGPPAPQEVPPSPPQETPPAPPSEVPPLPEVEPQPAPETPQAPPPADPQPAPLEAPVMPPADPTPAPAPLEIPAPLQEPEVPQQRGGGLIGRLFGKSQPAAPVVRRALDDEMIESLEELLIQSDMGVDTALRVTSNIAEGRYGKRVSTQEIKELLSGEVARIMEPVAKPLPLYAKKPQVVLVVGVNGSGKTTTIGKLASQFRAAGKSVVIAAGDTFRAAAVEQLQIWGDRAGVPVLTAPEGSDPASLAFDAMTKAQAEGADLLMIDTAGRLQNRSDLMEELAKIVRVIRKKDPDAPHNTLLVLDATTGQNALRQVEIFQQVADVSGLVMTKLDGTARGGVLVALADKFGLPIHAIGVGEQIDDLQPFDPEEFAAALTGLETR
ncbi:signal recognition particle-docking protein FtsY [Salipiger mangrovisoli]|uniref:Signal recognition particle receptor FtsY n=1 Tax=Salipiger mangrovisoli TaxID=2865933 RepID=A0ABR9X8F2_9RHOB|nr:signal recognition particle-docking protein FtsY [Salipiger mangrovisoli]MBE9639722.1 signal recognition particle-docking protein FtsY [Salipiger mangrovisoli]